LFNRQIGAGLPGLGTLGASSEAPMSSAAAPAESTAGCGADEDEPVAACWTSQSDSRGDEKSQTRELLESWLLRLRLL